MAQDIFAASPEMGARQRWALQQLQQGSDPSPVHHPLQALARALQGAIGGYTVYQGDQEDKAAGAAMFNSLPGIGGGPQAQPSTPAPLSAPAEAPGGSLPQQLAAELRGSPPYSGAVANIESGGKYDKLGPVIVPGHQLAGDRAYGKYQVMGSNVGPWTKQYFGQELSPQDFASNPEAQEAVFKGEFGRLAQKYGPEGASRAWFAGEGGMNKPGRTDQLGTSVAGYGQKFAAGMGAQPPIQMAALGAPQAGAPQMPGGAPPQAPPAGPQMAQNGVPGAQPPQALNAPVPNRSSVQIPPDVQATIQRLGADPRTRPQALQLYMQYAKPVESIQPMSPEQRKQWNVPEGMSAGIDTVTGKPTFSPPQTNVNLNTAQKGQEVMATESAQDFKAAQAAGREATKRSGVWDAMEQASKGFTPGATADIKLQARRYLKDLGVIEGADVPDAEVFKQMQQQLAIHAQPKGQGAVSNFERDMYSKSIANMTMSPEALTRAIDMGRKLDSFDRKVAEIYRNNARKNGGVPNSIDINEEIDKLGAPLSQSELNYLRRTGEGKPGTASPASNIPAPPPGFTVR